MDSDRWPMTRGELATRLSLALERTRILIDLNRIRQLQGLDGDEDFGTILAHAPAELTEELLGDIEQQGTDEVRDTHADPDLCARCGNQFPAGQLCDACHGAPLPMPADAPYPLVTEYPDLTAAASIIRELETLSGTSGAGWDHMVNVLRFAAGHFGYEIAEQDT